MSTIHGTTKTENVKTPAEVFFEELFLREETQGTHTHIWHKSDKRSFWFTTDTPGFLQALRGAGKEDVYIGLGMVDEPRGATERARIADVTAIACLWLDVDCGHVGHKKAFLPEDAEEGMDLVYKICKDNDMPLPRIRVNSGHGLHLYWPLRESVVGQAVTPVVKTWSAWWMEQFKKNSRVCDPTTPAQLLRIPGTWNCKEKDKVEVTMEVYPSVKDRVDAKTIIRILGLGDDGLPKRKREPRVASSEAQGYVPTQGEAEQPVVIDRVGSREFDPKVLAAIENARLSQRILEERNSYPSQSERDFALCIVLLKAGGFSRQEITNAMLALEYKFKGAHHVKQAGYYSMTIDKATVAVGPFLKAAALAAKQEKTGKTAYEEASSNLMALKDVLGVGIRSITKYPGSTPVYELVTEGGEMVRFAGSSHFETHKAFSRMMVEQGDIIVRPVPKKDWYTIYVILMRNTVTVDTDLAGIRTDKGAHAEMLTAYFRDMGKIKETAIIDKDTDNNLPTVIGDYVVLLPMSFHKWQRELFGTKMSMQELGTMFATMGGKPFKLGGREWYRFDTKTAPFKLNAEYEAYRELGEDD